MLRFSTCLRMSQKACLTVLFLVAMPLFAQPQLNDMIPLENVVEQYGKFELSLDLSATYSNPYDYEEIEIGAVFTSPGGERMEVEGFFMEEFDLAENGALSSIGEGFKLRFSPNQVGSWTYQVSITDQTGTITSSIQTFDCVAISHARNHGFVRTNGGNYLLHDDGEQYIPIGENMAWQSENPFIDYKNWLGEYIKTGANFLRLWHAHWGLGIEWKAGWRGFEGMKRYHQQNSRYQDWLYDFCADNGIYVMLCLQHHGQVSSQVNSNWSDNYYNTENGGPCENTWDFFMDETAMQITKNRFRYVLARWGYSRSIMAWELWNEVDWTDKYDHYEEVVREWHEDMIALIKRKDPYGHLITTSFAKEEHDPLLWINPDIDLSQIHLYANVPNLEKSLSSSVRSYLNQFGKPVLNGEFGLGADPSGLRSTDPDGIHIHNGLWGGLFGGGLGTAMSWWWDLYIHPQDLYYHFDPLSQLIQDIPFVDKDMSPSAVVVRGASGILSLNPAQDWGIIGTSTITVNPDGSLSPEAPVLPKYLYGSRWNTEFRSPPTFLVSYPEDGSFTVRTSSTTSPSSPRVAIWLDGSKVLDQRAQTNEEYSIQVSAGPHEIKVDNPGNDWISIASYEFADLGSKVDAYVLTALDETVAAGWVINNQYNHLTVPRGNEPSPIIGAQLNIPEFKAGTYYVKWYNCLTGKAFKNHQVEVGGEGLSLSVPDVLWDAAFIVDEKDVTVEPDSILLSEDMQIYPNPVEAGDKIVITSPELAEEQASISMLDAAGRLIATSELEVVNGRLIVTVPDQLATGMYWVQLDQSSPIGIKPVLVR